MPVMPFRAYQAFLFKSGKPMKILSTIILFLLAAMSFAQVPKIRPKFAHIVQYHYKYNEEGKKNLDYVKVSHFDSSSILVLQERMHFAEKFDSLKIIPKFDSLGKAEKIALELPLNAYYYYEYNPSTQIGNYYSQSFNAKNNDKKETGFKSFDHSEKHIWEKQYNAAKMLRVEIENTYDDKGYLLSTFSRDHNFSPPIAHSEEVKRNSAGLMTTWESYDEDENGRQKVREMNWVYKQDTILLKSSGYIYNNWNEVVHNYNKKTRLPEKTLKTFGYRNDKGEIKRNHKHETLYKKGLPSQIQEYEYNKKTKLHKFVYTDSTLISISNESIIEKGFPNELITTTQRYNSEKRLLMLSKSKNGESRSDELYEYFENGQISRYMEAEYVSGGKKSSQKTTEYNESGNQVRKLLYINNKLAAEDIFKYISK